MRNRSMISVRGQIWLAILSMLLPMAAHGGKVSLQWDLSEDPSVEGYRLYYSAANGGLTNVFDVGNTNATTVTEVIENQAYEFFVTAYNSEGIESDPSNQLSYLVPPTPNSAPAISGIADQIGPVNRAIVIHASATDADLPAQALSFSLVDGAPSGSAIDPATGVFTWTPNAQQAGSTNMVAIRVTDNGSHALSATATFKVVVEGAKSYALKIGGFSGGTAANSPRGAFSASGDKYPAGATVTLTASPAAGFAFSGWSVNSEVIAENPVRITMNQDTLATPVFKHASGGIASLTGSGPVSLKINLSAGIPLLEIGGEAGAWVLEESQDLTTWNPVASGLTSERLAPGAAFNHSFFRVRPLSAGGS